MMQTSDDLEQLVSGVQAEGRMPSVVAAAAVGDRSIFCFGVGVASASSSVPADGGTQYRIGSITKTFTAALVVALCRERRLGLDDRVGEHITGTQLDRVTVAQLLSHSGGVQREPLTPMWQTFEGPDEAELAASLPSAELVAEPGERWHYSNLGYAILGQIVAQATGETCESLVQKRFLDPLSLARTSWLSMSPAAAGYRVDPYQDVLHDEPDMQQRAAGMGGQMWSTTTDLLEWAQALMGRRPDILPVESVDAMHTLRVLTDGDSWSQGWGLGLILTRRGGRVYAGHTGAVPGFSAALVTDRSSGVAVAAVANAMSGTAALAQLAFEVAERTTATTPARPVAAWQPGKPCPDELVELLGSWWFEAGEVVFSWRENTLRAELASGVGEPSAFVQEGPDRFRVVAGREQGELLVVHRDDGGEVEWLELATYPYSRRPR